MNGALWQVVRRYCGTTYGPFYKHGDAHAFALVFTEDPRPVEVTRYYGGDDVLDPLPGLVGYVHELKTALAETRRAGGPSVLKEHAS